MNTQLKTIFVFLFLVCTLRGTAQNFSIDYPSYQNRNSDALEISRIVRNDTATILYMDAYSRPDYWLRLASGLSLHGNQTGKNYPIIRSQGFELNKEVYMPASGNITFILQFAPLAPQEETIDFIEGTNKGDFQIKDISLNKQEKKGKIHCHISGKIIDSPQSSRLVLMKAHKNPSSSPWLSIPIRNGEFQYDFYADHEEVYEVFIWNDMLTGSWLPSLFFAENGPVSFTLYPASTRKPGLVSTSNPLTCELQQLESERKAKFNFDSLYAQMNKLYEENIPLVPHRARQMTRDDYLYFDYLIGMDSANIRNMTRIAGGTDSQDKIYKMLSFVGYEDTQKFTGARDVADPWYTGNFDETYEDVVAGCKGFLYYLQQKGDISREIEIPR